jgi:hypothetical protein
MARRFHQSRATAAKLPKGSMNKIGPGWNPTGAFVISSNLYCLFPSNFLASATSSLRAHDDVSRLFAFAATSKRARSSCVILMRRIAPFASPSGFLCRPAMMAL